MRLAHIPILSSRKHAFHNKEVNRSNSIHKINRRETTRRLI